MATEATESVTFVNGIAAEQQTEGEGSGIPIDEREAAVAAVKAALKEEAKKAGESSAKEAKESREQDPLRPRKSVERDVDGKFVAKAEDGKEASKEPPKEDAEEESKALKRALQERKQIASAKASQQAEFAKQAQQLQNFHAQLQQQKAELERDRQRLAKLRSDPAGAIRDNGWDPETFILDLAQEGTPEGQARRQQRELQQQLAEMKAWKEAQETQRAENERLQHMHQLNQRRAQVEQHFVGLALDEGKHPHLSAFYQGHEASLVAEGDSIADQYRNLTGKEATFEDIAEYLEERAAKWYKTMNEKTQSGASQRSQKASAPSVKGRPTQGSATGRTLSPEDSSERRSLGANLKDLDGDERLATAREAVAVAIRASGERQ